MTIWKFLHIASMFVAVSIFVGQGMLSGVVARSEDVRALRRVLAAEDRFTPIGGGFFLLGLAFGFVTAIVGEIDLGSRPPSRRASTIAPQRSCTGSLPLPPAP